MRDPQRRSLPQLAHPPAARRSSIPPKPRTATVCERRQDTAFVRHSCPCPLRDVFGPGLGRAAAARNLVRGGQGASCAAAASLSSHRPLQETLCKETSVSDKNNQVSLAPALFGCGVCLVGRVKGESR